MPDPCANVTVHHHTFGPFRGGIYNLVKVRWWTNRQRTVEVNVSPTGRSVTVYVEGEREEAPDARS